MPHRPETSATPAAVAIPDSIDSLQPPLVRHSQQPPVDISNAGLVVCVADIFDFSGSLARYVVGGERFLVCLAAFNFRSDRYTFT